MWLCSSSTSIIEYRDLSAHLNILTIRDYQDHSFQAVEDAYRAVLAGAAPAMLNKMTDREFRRFVVEMLEFLTDVLDRCSASQPNRADSFSRQDILDIIAVLVLNAASSSHESVRRRRGTRGPASVGEAVKRDSGIPGRHAARR